MEITHLTETQPYAEFFRHSVLEDIPYWERYLKDNATDNAALQCKREQIIKNIQFALDLERAWQPLQTLIPALSPYMERWGYWKQWQETLEYALQVAHHHQDKVGEVSLSALLARLLFQQSRYQEAICAYRRTIRLARQIGDHFNQARTYTNLGYHYIEQGQWHRAEVLCCHALTLFEQMGNDHGRAHTENHLGILYTRQQRWEQARHHLERACAIWQTMEDQHGLMRGYINLGLLYLGLEQPDTAMVYLEKTLVIAHLTGDETTIGRIYMNMGITQTIAKDSVQAEMYTQKAEAIFRQLANTTELARVWHTLGTICFYQGQWSEAILHLENALKVWRRLGNNFDEAKVLTDIIECELARGNSLRVTNLLEEAECLIRRHTQAEQTPYWSALLTKCRHLVEQSVVSSERKRNL